MRKVTLALALSISLAGIVGCGGSTTPLTSTPNTLADAGATEVPAAIMAAIDAQGLQAPSSTVEILDAETGAVVLRQDLVDNGDGTYDVEFREGQGLGQNALLHQAFRVGLTIDTEGPAGMVPRGYTPAGNPLFYIGDTVCYDTSIESRVPGRARWMTRLGSFDVEFRHLFAGDNSLLPECIPGQNPLTIQDVDFIGKTPQVGPYAWSPDGKAFGATGMQFKLCSLPGLQYGTDLINTRLYWVVPGSVFGLPCNTCEVRCVIFDRVVGIYDPPA
ncbi:MAG: hypothetical protein GEEBNDBF_00415 [bacterium]|nr:hypothetical protein [bacterium]